jgi:hypothetical protein
VNKAGTDREHRQPHTTGGFDRVRYQREYMRVYRARQRNEQGTDREQTKHKG